MPTLTLNQWFSIILVILGVLTASTAQLAEIMGPAPAKYVVSMAGLLSSIFAGILGVFTSQTNQIKDVRSMPGVEHIAVNENANRTLATLAVDPNEPKIAPVQGAGPAVVETAAS